MTVKELKEALAKLPAELDNVTVYAHSSIDEGADDIYGVEIYDKNTYESNKGTPYCKGDAPWDIDSGGPDYEWKGEKPFVVVG